MRDYYLPEIIELIELYKQSMSNLGIQLAKNCKETILTVKHYLETYYRSVKSNQPKIDAGSKCSTLKEMMVLDGFVPDELQKRIAKRE